MKRKKSSRYAPFLFVSSLKSSDCVCRILPNVIEHYYRFVNSDFGQTLNIYRDPAINKLKRK